MNFAVLSLAATAALALSVGTASAQPWGHHSHHYYGGYYGHYRPAYGYSSSASTRPEWQRLSGATPESPSASRRAPGPARPAGPSPA